MGNLIETPGAQEQGCWLLRQLALQANCVSQHSSILCKNISEAGAETAAKAAIAAHPESHSVQFYANGCLDVLKSETYMFLQRREESSASGSLQKLFKVFQK
jgi:hypothetical protein